MFVRYMCLKCGQKIKVDASMVGEMLGCPNCRYSMHVPPPTQADISQALEEVRRASQDPNYVPPPDNALQPDLSAYVDKKQKVVRTTRGSLYIFMLLASVPLFLSIVLEQKDSVVKRIEQTIDALPKAQKTRAYKVYNDFKRDEADIDEVVDVLPGKKIKGAWLPQYSNYHLYFTIAATVGSFLLIGLLFPQGFSKFYVKLFVAFFTATAGLALLYIVQGGNGAVVLAGPIGLFIGLIRMCYHVVDLDVPFGTLLFANIFGVGLCEEVIKALPVFYIMVYNNKLRWYECCTLGLASGVGFGLVEAYGYGKMYHGLHDEWTYAMRFISCVISHGVSTAASAMFVHRFSSLAEGHLSAGEALFRLVIMVSIPMCLHGLYNTLCSKDMEGLALAVDLVNFGWLALMIESARDREGDARVQYSTSS